MKPLTLATTLCAFLVTLGAPTSASATTLGLGAANSYGNYLGQAISPYNGKLNGSTIASGIICLDITITSNYNTQWTVTTATPTAVAEQRAAFLALQLFNATAATRGALTMAIWYIMDTSGTLAHVPGVANDAATMSFVNAAQSATLNPALYTNVAIYSPTNTTNQRFMALQQVSAVPEPGTFLLLGAGAAILFRFRKRQLGAQIRIRRFGDSAGAMRRVTG